LTAVPAYLIDASIYIFQAHFSPYTEYYDDEGSDLSAVFGFTQFLIGFLRRTKPLVLAVAMDESLFCGFRHKLCPKYKSNRELPDANLAMQMNACAKISSILGLATFGSRTYEADDIIGTLSNRLHERGGLGDWLRRAGICIVSRDKDLVQLVNHDADFIWDYQNNRRRFRADILEEFGVLPEQIPDYLGLVGDSVDCISGIPGIGPVKGRALLQEFYSLDAIYKGLPRVGSLTIRGAGKLAKVLEDHREQAYLSRKLATIVGTVCDESEPFSVADLATLVRRPADTSLLYKFLRDTGFNSELSGSLVKAVERLNQSQD